MKESFINRRTLSEPGEDALDARTERVRADAAKLVEFFESKGGGEPVRKVLEEGFRIVPTTKLIHSMYWSPDGNAPPTIELSLLGQTPGRFGRHTRMHEMGHALSKHENLDEVTEVLFPDGTRRAGMTRSGGKTGFHYWLQRGKDEHPVELFSALNEALTDAIPIEILKTQNWGKIYQHFLYIYPRERNMLTTIISSMAKDGGESEENIFGLFVESYLSGWKPELKQKLLTTFGPNALRVLAIINAPFYVKDKKDAVTLGKWWQFFGKNYYKEALAYFDVEMSLEERDAAARKILPAEGALRFVERKQLDDQS